MTCWVGTLELIANIKIATVIIILNYNHGFQFMSSIIVNKSFNLFAVDDVNERLFDVDDLVQIVDLSLQLIILVLQLYQLLSCSFVFLRQQCFQPCLHLLS